MHRAVLAGTVLFTVAASGWALAQGAAVSLPSDTVIAARQAAFDLQAGVAAAMKAGVDGGTDVKPYVQGAKGIAAWGKVIPSMFPAGTESGHGTKAKSEIWSDRAGFEKAAANLVTEAEKLQALADTNDKPGFAAQFKATGDACGACHRAYRER